VRLLLGEGRDGADVGVVCRQATFESVQEDGGGGK